MKHEPKTKKTKKQKARNKKQDKIEPRTKN
jgi:hypothetical protein